MKNMKKLLSTILTFVLVLSMTTVAFATNADQDASFTKTYKITNEGTSNPAETFEFTFAADHVTDSNKNLTEKDMPVIPKATVEYTAGTATTAGLEKTVAVALDKVEWPGVGVYYYTVNEVAGNTAGVTYDATTAYLKVTVAYDEGTDTYYTAFVTLNLEDEDKDGITDSKVGGFTNVYSAGSLEIKKEVTGNMGDKSAYFAVKVTLNGEEGKKYQESYAIDGGSKSENPEEANPETIAIGTETTFYLKDQDTIIIKNLPYGVTYTVVEADYTTAEKGNYDEAKYTFTDEAKKIDSAKDTVTIINNKGTIVDTGIVMDSAPYIVLLAIVCVGFFGFVSKKRMMDEI